MLRRGEYPRTDRHVCLRRGALVSGSGGSKVFTARLLGTLELSVVLNTALICSRLHQTSHTEYYGILSSAHGPVVGPCLPTQLLSLPDWTTLAFLLDLSCLSCDRCTAVRTWLIGATSQTHPVPLGSPSPTEPVPTECGTTHPLLFLRLTCEPGGLTSLGHSDTLCRKAGDSKIEPLGFRISISLCPGELILAPLFSFYCAVEDNNKP